MLRERTLRVPTATIQHYMNNELNIDIDKATMNIKYKIKIGRAMTTTAW